MRTRMARCDFYAFVLYSPRQSLVIFLRGSGARPEAPMRINNATSAAHSAGRSIHIVFSYSYLFITGASSTNILVALLRQDGSQSSRNGSKSDTKMM